MVLAFHAEVRGFDTSALVQTVVNIPLPSPVTVLGISGRYYCKHVALNVTTLYCLYQ